MVSMVYLENVIKALPKVEQHVHLMGSTRPETLMWLFDEGGMRKPFKTIEGARRFFRFRDFPHFIEVYKTVFRCVTKEEQFERITYEMLEDDARCNVKYVEASFSAPDHVREGLDYELMLDAINRGAQRAQNDFGIRCNLRIDLVRNYGPKNGMQVLDWIEGKRENIVSIDIGGSEEEFPPKPFAPVYQRAKQMGLHLVAHAGEAARPESIWDAVKYLNVERIGHGVTAVQDLELVEFLRKKGITIEACPTSNLRTGVVSSLRDHPIRALVDNGVRVTVNSDDPSMFNTDMNHEYLQLHRYLDFSIRDLIQLTRNALDSSFMQTGLKTQLRRLCENEHQRLLEEVE
ncbi:MAG: adenosine deaminase [Candidatus Bathyarchaeota archaeon]|nr:MAG: adenosine deaminase [Candidatus Bathyarchaeota archaeon]